MSPYETRFHKLKKLADSWSSALERGPELAVRFIRIPVRDSADEEVWTGRLVRPKAAAAKRSVRDIALDRRVRAFLSTDGVSAWDSAAGWL